MLTSEILERLIECLSILKTIDGAPQLDAEWLELQCRDTLASHRNEPISPRHIKMDIDQFLEEFPNILPPDLVELLTRPEPIRERGPWSRPEPW